MEDGDGRETRWKLDAGFKQGAVLLVAETGELIAQIAKVLCINAGYAGLLGERRTSSAGGQRRAERG